MNLVVQVGQRDVKVMVPVTLLQEIVSVINTGVVKHVKYPIVQGILTVMESMQLVVFHQKEEIQDV